MIIRPWIMYTTVRYPQRSAQKQDAWYLYRTPFIPPSQLSPSRLPRSIDRQPIGLDIPLIPRMPLNPFELRPGAHVPPLLNLRQHNLHQILVLHWLPRCVLPPVAAPVDAPRGDAVDGVLAVGDDLAVAVQGDDVQGARDGGEFGALVGLACAG